MAGTGGAQQTSVEPWPTGRRRPVRPAPAGAQPPPLVLRSHRRPPPPPVDLSAPRPPVVDDTSLLGFSRLTRSRVGARLYRLAVALLFLLILLQLVDSLLHPT